MDECGNVIVFRPGIEVKAYGPGRDRKPGPRSRRSDEILTLDRQRISGSRDNSTPGRESTAACSPGNERGAFRCSLSDLRGPLVELSAIVLQVVEVLLSLDPIARAETACRFGGQ